MNHGNKKAIRILPISEEHIESFYNCLDSVARERRYLGLVKAPPLESTSHFVLSNIKGRIPQQVALEDSRVVGWCDITPNKGEGFTHCGTLGMGVLPDYRGRGIGAKLLEETLLAAKKFGLERVELEVFASNIPAIRLYENRGFSHEGVKRKARKLDGIFDDVLMMALFLN